MLIERNPELCFQETILWSDILHRHNEFRADIQVESTRTRSCEWGVCAARGGSGGFQPPLAPPVHSLPCAGPDCRALCAEGHCWGEGKQDCQTCECGAHRGSDPTSETPKAPGNPFPSLCMPLLH